MSPSMPTQPPPQCPCSPTTAKPTLERPTTTSISNIHPDILKAHILPRLDGPALVSTVCTSTELNLLGSEQELWDDICHSTWPSTFNPRVRQIISHFPSGSRSFFSQSFPLPTGHAVNPPDNPIRPSELISAVDIYYQNDLIFSRVVETETSSAWFLCSPFRIDMLDPKDTCQTAIKNLEAEHTCNDLAKDLSLSWILIDPTRFRAVNLSSHKPVSAQRHWLSGEVHARSGTVLTGGERGSASEFVQYGIVVTFGSGAQGEGMHVTGVSLQVEDMDGIFLDGRGSLEIMERAFEGTKGIGARKEVEGRKRYEMFLERKRKRKERRLKNEGTLDLLCVASGVLVFLSFGLFLLLR